MSPSPVDFGDVPVGGEKVETVTVTNSGTGDLRVYPSTATSPGTELSDKAGVFSVAANSVAGATIAPGASASLRVRFNPGAPDRYMGTLTISSNAGTTPIDLRGQATEKPPDARPAGGKGPGRVGGPLRRRTGR